MMKTTTSRQCRTATLLATLCLVSVLPALADQDWVEALPGDDAVWTLENCIDAALTGNDGLLAERERRRELDGQMAQARATGLPTLDLTGTWSRGRDPSFAFNSSFGGGEDGGFGFEPPDSLSPEAQEAVGFIGDMFSGLALIPPPEDIEAQTFYRTSLNARWELRPGLVFNAVGAAGLGIERQEAALLDREQRLVEAVSGAYYRLLSQAETLSALDADLAAKLEFLDLTRRRQQLDLATPLDTLRAAVALANLRPQRNSAAQGLADAGIALNVQMGRAGRSPLRIDTDLNPELDPLPADLVEVDLSGRSDLLQLQLMEQILRKNRGAQKSEHRPYLSADAAYGYVGTDLDGLFDEGHDFWSANVSVNLPLFDGLSTRGKVKETEAAIRRSHHEYVHAGRLARQELLATLGDLLTARDNLAAGRLNETAAEEARRQTQQRYELGLIDYLSVLDAQTQRRQARELRITARTQVLTLTASLKRLLGSDPRRPLAEVLADLAGARDNELSGGTR
jgi:outer membrane protein TolC